MTGHGLLYRALPLALVLLAPGCFRARAGLTPEDDAARRERIETLYQDYRRDFPDVNEVTPQGLLDLRAAGDVVIVDVRTREEQRVSALPGAIARAEFEANRERYRDFTVVTYCTIGARSGAYAERLRGEGCEVFNLKGSVLAWTHAGMMLVDGEGRETRTVHTYGPQWDLVAEGYESVW
ncbi:MAG: rhodanese-like domain-containing protein [Candidatus Hydrogenedentes bacterium]|nr:rhodanese-like domain-containing protein [Candidatus Hydrogenedentota bacterium]